MSISVVFLTFNLSKLFNKLSYCLRVVGLKLNELIQVGYSK